MTEKSEQEKLAREWAEYYQNDFPKFSKGSRAAEIVEKAKAAAAYILATTTPPTMAEIEWEDGEHFLAGATNYDGIEMAMLADVQGDAILASPLDDPGATFLECPGDLTPNGKRYELREVGADQPERPKTLRTVEDYADAPMGTIVATPAGIGAPFLKLPDGQWYLGDKSVGCAEMAIAEPREVLRWGRGK